MSTTTPVNPFNRTGRTIARPTLNTPSKNTESEKPVSASERLAHLSSRAPTPAVRKVSSTYEGRRAAFGQKSIDDDDVYLAALDDDEEVLALKVKEDSEGLQELQYFEDDTTRALRKSFADMGRNRITGITKSRFITFDILLNAPEDYFDMFDEPVDLGTKFVKGSLVEKGISQLVADARANPDDMELQEKAYAEIYTVAMEYLERHQPQLKSLHQQITVSFIVNDIIGFGKLDPIWRNKKISEILINGPKDVQIELGGKLVRMPAVKFRNADHLLELINRFYNAINREVAAMTPIMEGRLHDKSRLQAVHPVVAPEGPLLSVRRFPEKTYTIEDMMDFGALDKDMAIDLGNLIYKGCSYLVVGGTGTGKTTMLNALGGFYRNDVRILTAEDNLELMLPKHKLLVPGLEVVRPKADAPGSGISMTDLIKSAMRMRPDVVIVGEVRGGEAMDLVQALNTGHAGAGTVHANSEEEAVGRLINLVTMGGNVKDESSVLPMIASAFDIFVQLMRFPEDGSRRIVGISEVNKKPSIGPDGRPTLTVNKLWEFVTDKTELQYNEDGSLKTDAIGKPIRKIYGHWEKRGEISDERRRDRYLDLIPDLSYEELIALTKPLEK